MNEETIKSLLKKQLTEKRYRHSLAVSEAAVQLAKRYGADVDKARFAGLVHDICKDETKDMQLQRAEEFAIILTESEQLCPKLWHAIVGAGYVKRFLSNDDDIIRAVRYHTTARAGMSLLEKVIYVADCISADRDYSHVEELRVLAEKSLDDVILEMTGITIRELVENGSPLHEDTVYAYNPLCIEKARAIHGEPQK